MKLTSKLMRRSRSPAIAATRSSPEPAKAALEVAREAETEAEVATAMTTLTEREIPRSIPLSIPLGGLEGRAWVPCLLLLLLLCRCTR
jgi:hypothetical protein